jgi:hypothetical protein
MNLLRFLQPYVEKRFHYICDDEKNYSAMGTLYIHDKNQVNKQ